MENAPILSESASYGQFLYAVFDFLIGVNGIAIMLLSISPVSILRWKWNL